MSRLLKCVIIQELRIQFWYLQGLVIRSCTKPPWDLITTHLLDLIASPPVAYLFGYSPQHCEFWANLSERSFSGQSISKETSFLNWAPFLLLSAKSFAKRASHSHWAHWVAVFRFYGFFRDSKIKLNTCFFFIL